MIQEYYRQMRKFGCNILAVVQQYDVLKTSEVRGAMIGNSKMFLGLKAETVKTAISLVGTGSPTSKTLKKKCSSASRRISRSGLIRKLNETRANCGRAGKIGSAIGGLQSGEGRGGWREVLIIVGRLSVVAIFGCHL